MKKIFSFSLQRKVYISKTLKNAAFIAKIGVDTAENGPPGDWSPCPRRAAVRQRSSERELRPRGELQRLTSDMPSSTSAFLRMLCWLARFLASLYVPTGNYMHQLPQPHACSQPQPHACSQPQSHACSQPKPYACSQPKLHACSQPKPEAQPGLQPGFDVSVVAAATLAATLSLPWLRRDNPRKDRHFPYTSAPASVFLGSCLLPGARRVSKWTRSSHTFALSVSFCSPHVSKLVETCRKFEFVLRKF